MKVIGLTGSTVEKQIQNRDLQLFMEWANPLNTTALNAVMNSGLLPPGNSGSQINLIGNGNYFKMEGDTLSAYLPYFGERRMGGGYGRNTQIEFKDVPVNLEIKRNETKERFEISFTISDHNRPTENYQVRTEVYPNGRSAITINSSDRTVISYTGRVEAIK